MAGILIYASWPRDLNPGLAHQERCWWINEHWGGGELNDGERDQ